MDNHVQHKNKRSIMWYKKSTFALPDFHLLQVIFFNFLNDNGQKERLTTRFLHILYNNYHKSLDLVGQSV